MSAFASMIGVEAQGCFISIAESRRIMDILDRLLGHDEWTTLQVIDRCAELTPAQLQQSFDIGHHTVEQTLRHLIGNVEVWTDLFSERPVRSGTPLPVDTQFITTMRSRFVTAYAAFATRAREIRDTGRLDDRNEDVLDTPPTPQTFGGTIVHVVTHDMLHRSEVLHLLERLGLSDLLEGDALSWEMQQK